ncbi:Tyrosine-protein phosphatase Lar [Orchesella cincta]|uniref:Tyrosine-protein phosphatase Lar n=1 Tax=Orchesella cincta TaxID=48709 RepID=A0A1D2NDC9_ORCCI|nr:Tyrosine-protein phosphatase Lar [Orchesella cincta]
MYPPQIVEKLKDQRVKAGSPATFYCRVTGDPPPTIHWRKNGKKQPGGHTRIFIENFPGVSMLRINPARHVRDDASYECMAENGVGDPVTASANLTVFSDQRGGMPAMQCQAADGYTKDITPMNEQPRLAGGASCVVLQHKKSDEDQDSSHLFHCSLSHSNLTQIFFLFFNSHRAEISQSLFLT